MQKEALFYKQTDDLHVICELCHHLCRLSNGQYGNCGVRQNIEGKLYTDTYECLTALHMDPIEKKPLYHFFPGKRILSVGSFGCNLHCIFCQNHEISQVSKEASYSNRYQSDDLIILALKEQDNIGIAYTYNEPTVSYEFMIETAAKIRVAGLKNVMVSNGYISMQALDMLINIVDGFNIDLKFFSEDSYRKYTDARLLPVLDNLTRINASNKHLEITHLLVNGLNDKETEFRSMLHWIKEELGPESILHISGYFPRFRYRSAQTPEEKLTEFYGIAKEYLAFVYIGNAAVAEGQHTICPNCNEMVIRRNGYHVHSSGISENGCCRKCNQRITWCGDEC